MMGSGRRALGATLAIFLLGGAGLALHHFYGRIAHEIEGIRPGIQSDDLYSPANKLFKRGRRDLPEVCLTIDDGPHAGSLSKILDTLKDFNVKATFFMVGKRIQQNPEMVREVLREGHEVGNHTQNHPRLDDLTPDQIRYELSLCEKNFEIATGGTKMTLFRPPGMRFTPELFRVVSEFGYTTVDWNYGGKDFMLSKDGPTVAGGENIAKYVLERVTPGGIILLHDNKETADALRDILQGLKDRGYAVKNVTQMMAELPEPVMVESNAGKLGPYAAR